MDALDADRETLAPLLAETEFLLSDVPAEALFSSVSALREGLGQFAVLVPSDPALSNTDTLLNDVDALVAQTFRHSASARRALGQVDAAMAVFRVQSDSRAARLLDEQTAASRVADAAEEELRLLN